MKIRSIIFVTQYSSIAINWEKKIRNNREKENNLEEEYMRGSNSEI